MQYVELTYPDLPIGEDPKYDDGYPIHITSHDIRDADLTEADISDTWDPEQQRRIMAVLRKHQELFRPDLGRFNDGMKIPIPFKPGVDISDLLQRPFGLSRRDRTAMDGILDPLKETGVVEDVPLGQPSPASSPAFVV